MNIIIKIIIIVIMIIKGNYENYKITSGGELKMRESVMLCGSW